MICGDAAPFCTWTSDGTDGGSCSATPWCTNTAGIVANDVDCVCGSGGDTCHADSNTYCTSDGGAGTCSDKPWCTNTTRTAENGSAAGAQCNCGTGTTEICEYGTDKKGYCMVTGTDGVCHARMATCATNYRVKDNLCEKCFSGWLRLAGDDPHGDNTYCYLENSSL